MLAVGGGAVSSGVLYQRRISLCLNVSGQRLVARTGFVAFTTGESLMHLQSCVLVARVFCVWGDFDPLIDQPADMCLVNEVLSQS